MCLEAVFGCISLQATLVGSILLSLSLPLSPSFLSLFLSFCLSVFSFSIFRTGLGSMVQSGLGGVGFRLVV